MLSASLGTTSTSHMGRHGTASRRPAPPFGGAAASPASHVHSSLSCSCKPCPFLTRSSDTAAVVTPFRTVLSGPTARTGLVKNRCPVNTCSGEVARSSRTELVSPTNSASCLPRAQHWYWWNQQCNVRMTKISPNFFIRSKDQIN